MKVFAIEIDNNGEYESYHHHTYRCFLIPDQTCPQELIVEFEKKSQKDSTFSQLCSTDRY